jgi:phage shock protein A
LEREGVHGSAPAGDGLLSLLDVPAYIEPMSTVQSEVFHAFRSIGVEETTALQAAAALNRRDEDVGALKSDVGAIRADLVGMKTDITTLKTDVGALKADVGILKADVGVLKADVGVLKADVGFLKTDVGVLKTDVGSLKADVNTLKANELLMKWMIGFILAMVTALFLKQFVG